MKTTFVSVCLLALCLLSMLALPADAAPRPERRGHPTIGSCNLVPKSSMQWFMPVLFLDDDGNITFTKVPVAGNFLKEGEFELEGACNGGQCAAGGAVLNCPTSGGPTCTSGQSCYCVCSDGGSHNECRN